MGFRFRKSIKFGPLRINLGKKGVGYSVGVPGARLTKLSTGRERTTLSLPGTGISWVKESSNKKKPCRYPPQAFGRTTRNSFSDTELINFQNSHILLKILYKYKYMQFALKALSCMSLLLYFLGSTYALALTGYFLCISLYIHFFLRRFRLKFSSDSASLHKQQNISYALDILKNSERLIKFPSSINHSKQYSLKKLKDLIFPDEVKISQKKLPLIKSTPRSTFPKIRIGKEKLTFLPFGILIEGFFSLKIFPIKEVRFEVGTTIITEANTPKDSLCTEEATWEHLNSRERPGKDSILKQNKYGVFRIFIPNGLTTGVLFSNYQDVNNINKHLEVCNY